MRRKVARVASAICRIVRTWLFRLKLHLEGSSSMSEENLHVVRPYEGLLSFKNLKAWADGEQERRASEFVLYSDSHFTGTLPDERPYAFVNLVPGTVMHGNVQEVLLLRIFWFLETSTEWGPVPHGTDTSEYHGGLVQDEIAALASLRLGVRLKAGRATREFDLRKDDRFGEAHANRVSLPSMRWGDHGTVLPIAKRTASLDELDHLSDLRLVDKAKYAALVKAARSYQEALWVAENDPAYAWQSLISAMETAAHCWWVDVDWDEAAVLEDVFETRYPDLSESLRQAGNSALFSDVVRQIGPTQQATAKFMKFAMAHKPGPPSLRPPDFAQIKWSNSELKKLLSKVYEHRSIALHSGTPFPGHLCGPPDTHPDWEAPAERGSIGEGGSSGGGWWQKEDLPISLNMFTYFVRGCLTNWWDSLAARRSAGSR